MSKRVNLPYAYQDLFPQATNLPRDFRTPGSISAASFAESSSRNTASAFAPARTHDRQGLLGNWKRLLKRLFKPKTLDFETATWEVFHLIVNPRKMYRSNYTYKQQNSRRSSYARDDPSFLILLTALLSFSAIAWGLAYLPHFWDIVKLIINMVCVDFYVTGFFIATLLWLLTNKLANSLFSIPHAFSAASRYNVNYIDWTFCFDVHCNSFLMIWCLLYMLQFFLLPLINSKKLFVSLLLGNSLYFGAVGYYFVITFYGFNSLPFFNSLTVTRSGAGVNPAKVLQLIIIAGILPILAIGWILTIVFRVNVAYTMVDNYFN